MKNKRQILTFTVILLAVLLPLCLYSATRFFYDAPSRVVIKQDGKVIKTLPLDRDGDFTVHSPLGKNVLQVKNGTVSVTEADCPDKICVKTAALSRQNPSVIVCLPHKLIITLEK